MTKQDLLSEAGMFFSTEVFAEEEFDLTIEVDSVSFSTQLTISQAQDLIKVLQVGIEDTKEYKYGN